MEQAIRTYRWMLKGFLPAGGGLLDQSHSFLKVAEFIERLWTHFENKRLEELADGRK